jgi:Zn-finger protein
MSRELPHSHCFCPRCKSESLLIGISVSRGQIFQCKSCKIPVGQDDQLQTLLWFWDIDRLWESFDKPEGLKKPELVKVILAAKVENIDFINSPFHT